MRARPPEVKRRRVTAWCPKRAGPDRMPALLTSFRHLNGHTERLPEFRPELGWRYGYRWVLALMVVVPTAIVLWERKKNRR